MTKWVIQKNVMLIKYPKISHNDSLYEERKREDNYITISEHAEKHLVPLKTLKKLGIGRNFLNFIKDTYGNAITNYT